MGSLPSPTEKQSAITITITITSSDLSLLFDSQRSHLNHFFDRLDLSQATFFANTLLHAPAAVFFSGIAKSGIVAHKLSQTLASLGLSRASFLSPVDALHGDIGAVFEGDIIILISKSGASEELLSLVPCAKAKGAVLVSLTSVQENPLSKLCDVNVHLPIQGEICPFNLAPVTSTAVQMIFGDTVVASVMAAHKVAREQYAANHPAGKIGKGLIFKVKDVMKKKEDLPICKEGDMIMDQLSELTSKGCGCLLVL
ncbi:Arabinose 5-phosphate isomerase [Rhynchospora pubera]|uniref:Arabinose 5-phosphate isomerase n=1 Tax=Rhynchospora pubera TaxID=906938 RepID=A0AAV8D473_9POAL|nr:Arabinose 5-phosphate isomerase [Rhynchospora pubera]KAJ4761306.1 Arabinose 5-phosphate isomerase [Rhynchospora pubera]KAJ4813791.1 Arabinose 5-phosphate isomerase [Rhynchospora pubera]